jgi:hypothetical protein
MTHDPIRQADIERRLSNLAKARRCGARRSGDHDCIVRTMRKRALPDIILA